MKVSLPLVVLWRSSSSLTGALALLLFTFGAAVSVHAANPFASTFTPIKEPECITDPTTAFFAENVAPAIPPHPSLPSEHFYLVARYLGDNAIAGAPTFDFSHFPVDYGYPPVRGRPLTGFQAPEPRWVWQRANVASADLDSSSAFQLYCADAGSFINSWMFPAQTIGGGGPHTIYGYSFNNPPPPAIYDANPETDLVLQAAIEIPWFANWPDRSADRQYDPVGQVSLFAYLRDRGSGKLFALLLAVYDNRAGPGAGYAPFISHDGATPFASTPLDGNPTYVTLSPYSAAYTGATWSGLRFFRGHVSQVQFRRAIDDVNTFCASHLSDRFCEADPRTGVAFVVDPAQYEMTDFGVLHEVFRGGPNGQISMGIHIYALGAWNAR